MILQEMALHHFDRLENLGRQFQCTYKLLISPCTQETGLNTWVAVFTVTVQNLDCQLHLLLQLQSMCCKSTEEIQLLQLAFESSSSQQPG